MPRMSFFLNTGDTLYTLMNLYLLSVILLLIKIVKDGTITGYVVKDLEKMLSRAQLFKTNDIVS